MGNSARGIKGRMRVYKGPFLIRVWKPCSPRPRASPPSLHAATRPASAPNPNSQLHLLIPLLRALTISSLSKHEDQTPKCDPITSCRCSVQTRCWPNQSPAHRPLSTPHDSLLQGLSSHAVFTLSVFPLRVFSAG